MDKNETKVVYAYNLVTKIYIGEKTLDYTDRLLISGAWQIPANCTETIPTDAKDGYDIVWNGSAWDYQIRVTEVLCYYNNGLDYKIVDSAYIVQVGEVIFNTAPTEDELKAAFPGYTLAVKQQKITQLNAEYQVKFEDLAMTHSMAALSDGDTVANKQDTQAALYQSLLSEKAIIRTAILNGTDSPKLKATTSDTFYFCPDCGNTLTWDSDGTISGAAFPCWCCAECSNIIPTYSNYPVQS